MFLGDTCTRDAQEIANLFGVHFQAVYVRDDPQMIQIMEKTVEQGILAIYVSLFVANGLKSN
jgi:hypothetical protein